MAAATVTAAATAAATGINKMTPSRPANGRGEERGFTLVEGAVALALLGVVLSFAFVSVKLFVSQRTLDGWSDTIVSDVRAAQQLAIARRTTATVTFAGGAPSTYSVSVGGTTMRGDTLASDLTLTSTTLYFNSQGIPVDSSGNQQTSAVTVLISDSTTGKSKTISVTPITGAVTAQ
jgi:prepilin-type N-terminal cleavage/methylation domain-containing protein